MIRLSLRDMTVLTVTAEMYGAPGDVVGKMLGGVSRRRVNQIADRWTAAGMISPLRPTPVPGPAWIFPTRAAAEVLIGHPVRAWAPRPGMAAHVRTALEIRLALVGLDLERWICERTLRSEVGPTKAGTPRPHIHDGRYRTPAGEWWAVEVELTPKNLTAARSAVAQAWQAARAADCAGVTYYCRGNAVKNVIRSAAGSLNLTDGPRLRLADVDELLAPNAVSAEPTPGLRVIPGGASSHDISGKAV
ncbi:hypothetical protein [Nocardia takedensis]|uniref:hypothetical protein n=1 Tax=Nocardia takedensis TaxID=259390 RepID=UPI0002D946AA|nr:hypothetical protein [Nocardia takedensis]